MLVIISPAKRLNEALQAGLPVTQPRHLERSEQLIRKLRRLSRKRIRELMSISDDLAKLNQGRYEAFSPPFDEQNAKAAVHIFAGDVYEGLRADTLNKRDMKWAQDHLRILSGLYGVLRPLDLIQPYRLEMGTRLPVGRRKNLYEFWDPELTQTLNGDLAAQGDQLLVNLASGEYFGAVKPKKLEGRIISPVFKERRGDELQLISFFAKKARGLMARWIIDQRLSDPEGLEQFDVEGYAYSPEGSTPDAPLFVRG